MGLLSDGYIDESTLIKYDFYRDGDKWIHIDRDNHYIIEMVDNIATMYAFYLPKKGVKLNFICETDFIFIMSNINKLCRKYYDEYIDKKTKKYGASYVVLQGSNQRRIQNI